MKTKAIKYLPTIDQPLFVGIADHIVKKINSHKKLVDNLSNMVFNFGASAKSVMQKKAVEYARTLLNEIK